jgi:aryl-alcohol dehydrogenase-like predicted oxidoreductase
MHYKQLGKSGLFLSDLTLGTMTYADEAPGKTAPAEAARQIHRYLDAGGNHIDTANVYNAGRSEEIIADALKGKRDQVILATKANFPVLAGINDKGLSRHNILRSVEASLKRLQTDYIDLFYMHCEDRLSTVEESLRAFDDLVKDGKVRYIGVSNFKAWRLMKALATSDAKGWNRFVAAQYQYSLVKRDIEYEFTELCEAEGLGILPWGPLGGGFLSGKYSPGNRPEQGRISTHPDHTEESWERRNTEKNWNILEVVNQVAQEQNATYAQIALAWLRHQPMVTSVILGARTYEQLEDNLGAATITLSNEQLKALDEVSQPEELYPYRMIDAYGRK